MKKLKETVRALSPEKRIEKAVGILNETQSGASQSMKMLYLLDQAGLTMSEYLEALNIAAQGELLKNI